MAISSALSACTDQWKTSRPRTQKKLLKMCQMTLGVMMTSPKPPSSSALHIKHHLRNLKEMKKIISWSQTQSPYSALFVKRSTTPLVGIATSSLDLDAVILNLKKPNKLIDLP